MGYSLANGLVGICALGPAGGVGGLGGKPTHDGVVLNDCSREVAKVRLVVHHVDTSKKRLLKKIERARKKHCSISRLSFQPSHLLYPYRVVMYLGPWCTKQHDAPIRRIIDHVILD